MYTLCLYVMLFVCVSGLYENSSRVGLLQSDFPCTDSNHLLLTPGLLASGSNTRVCLSRFHTHGSVHLTVTLPVEGKNSRVDKELPDGDGGCIDFMVPQETNKDVEMTVEVRYPDNGCTWSKASTLRIGSNRVVLIVTERSRYRPGDTIRLRVTALKSDLTPVHAAIEDIWLEGPSGAWGEGTRVVQWQRVRSRFGIAQVQYRLEPRAPPGRWKARARLADGSQGSSVFLVGDYKLPPFQLTVKHAPRVLRTQDRLVWTVCVRYPWSEAVEGMLVIRLRSAGVTGAGSGGVRTAVLLRSPRACHRHAAAAKRVGLGTADVVIADFSFQEDGTGIWQNTTVVSQVVEQPATLEIVNKQLTVISPGLPYKLKIKATRWDNRPAINEVIKVCKNPTDTFKVDSSSDNPNNPDDVCNEATTDTRGVARVTFVAGYDDRYKFYRFVATLKNNTAVASEPIILAVRRSSVWSASFGALVGDAKAPGSRVFVPLYLNLRNVKRPITVHFVVITRGGTIYRWGATTQCPISNTNNIYTASRDSFCDNPERKSPEYSKESATHDLEYSRNLTDYETMELTNLLKVMIPIKVSHQMCPESHLVAYFYFGGELVSASKRLEVEECFVNKAEITWLPRQVAPGSSASLQINTTPSSLCGLSALDVASKWLQDPGPSVKESLMGSLSKIVASSRNTTGFQALGDCFYSETPEAPNTGIDLTAAWLAEAGVRVIGGDVKQPRKCDVTPPAPLIEEEIVPRSDFSEAWLWRLVIIGSNGTAVVKTQVPDSITRFEANAFCVARNGVAISQPAVLQVFREFFIHADAPKKLRRGDSTVIQYRIFNYLYEPLAVQIQILAYPHLEILTSVTETACIAGRASIARRTEARARLEGRSRVSVRAIAVSDRRCGNYSGTGAGRRASDEVVLQIDIDPEGVPSRESRSALLCGENDETSSKVDWKWSEADVVPGTETVKIWATGDLTGPMLADADALVLLPRGCGEQNLARMATNLLALSQLDPRSAAAATAKDHVARGFARQLQYSHSSGGFSAFGEADGVPSTWLTAFAVRYMRRAHQILSPGSQLPEALIRAERWLLAQQIENGCFRNEGQVFHKELKGGLGNEGETANVALTAYVITSLLEGSVPLPARVVRNCMSCLRAMPPLKSKTGAGVYAHALLAYAYTRLRSYEASVQQWNSAGALLDTQGVPGSTSGVGGASEEELRLLQLMKMARRHGDTVFWEAGSLATSIEATGYAVLALSQCPESRRIGCSKDAAGARTWLSAHRGAAGGFLSTQDTLVALEALTAWSSMHLGAASNLTVSARVGVGRTAKLHVGASKVPIIVNVEGGKGVSVNVEGTGCALVQATRYYHSLTPTASSDVLTVQVAVRPDGPFDCDTNGTFCFCAAVVEACVVWSQPFPEMALLEVSLPGGFGADAARLYTQLDRPNTLVRRIELSPTGSRVSFYLGSRDGSHVTSGAGHQCFSIHAVGPRAKTKPAHARVIDYYNPLVNDTQIYTIPEDCPPMLSHEKVPKPNKTDIGYKNARSHDEEVIYTEDFAFENIPDGIPLDDPLYDNLQTSEENTDFKDSMEELDKDKTRDAEMINEVERKSLGEQINVRTNFNENLKEASTQAGVMEKYDLKSEENGQINEHLYLSPQAMRPNTKTNEHAYPYHTKTNENLRQTEQDFEAINKNLEHAEKSTDMKTNDDQQNGTKSGEKLDHTEEGNDNPKLSDFHVIDREADLDVPTGVEGPSPSVVLPPPGFVQAKQAKAQRREMAEYRQYTPHFYVFEYPYPVYLYPPRYYRSAPAG